MIVNLLAVVLLCLSFGVHAQEDAAHIQQTRAALVGRFIEFHKCAMGLASNCSIQSEQEVIAECKPHFHSAQDLYNAAKVEPIKQQCAPVAAHMAQLEEREINEEEQPAIIFAVGCVMAVAGGWCGYMIGSKK